MEAYEPLEPLIKEAEDTGQWLFTPYQGMWFTPKELREKNKNGSFRWGPASWQLVDPQEKIESLQKNVDEATEELDKWKEKLSE